MTHTHGFIQFPIRYDDPKYNQNVPPYTTQSNPTARFFIAHITFDSKQKKGFKKKRWSEVDFVDFKFQLLQKILDAHEIHQSL